MTQFESSVKKIPHPALPVFNFLSNFDHFESLLPPDKVSNWRSTGDTCQFDINGLGTVGLKIVEKEPSKTIKYSGSGKLPFDFFLWVQLKEMDANDTRLKLTLRAELNPMFKMIASEPLKKFLEIMANSIAEYPYQ